MSVSPAIRSASPSSTAVAYRPKGPNLGKTLLKGALKVAAVALPIIIAAGIIAGSAALTLAMISSGGAGVGLLLLSVVIITAAGAGGGLAFGALKNKSLSPVVKGITSFFESGPRTSKTALSQPAKINALEGLPKQEPEALVDTKAQFSDEATEWLNMHRLVQNACMNVQLRDGYYTPQEIVRHPSGEEYQIKICKDRGVSSYDYVNTRTGKVDYRFNDFADRCYNGAKTSDFYRRLNLIFEGADLGLRSVSEHKRREMKERLDEIYERAEAAIADGADIDAICQDGQIDEGEFDSRYEIAKAAIKDAFAEMSVLLEDVGVTTPLAQLEKEAIVAGGRPTIINTFRIDPAGPFLINVHKPLLDVTLPSSIREGEGLSNGLHNLSGYIDAQGRAVITQEAFRHSSTPPIGIKNTYDRFHGSVHNSKQIVSSLARTRLETLEDIPTNSEDHPIILDWNVMMLLTPKVIDAVNNLGSVRAGETAMLQEQLESMLHWDGRPLEMELNAGRKVWVQFNVSGMNLGANIPAMGSEYLKNASLIHKTLARLPDSSILKQLNRQGFMEFEVQVEDFLHTQIEKYRTDDPNLGTLLDRYSQLKNPALNQKVIEIKGKYCEQLRQWKEEIDACLEKGDRDRAAKIRNKINAVEEKKRKEIGQLYQGKLARYKDAGVTAAYRSLILTLDHRIERAQDEKVREELKTLRRVVENQNAFAGAFITHAYRNPRTMLHAQATYIETMSLMKKAVSFNCKSGEDRTGIVGVNADARDAQYTLREHGIERSLEQIVSRLIDVSPGTDTNDQNAKGARGFQISDRVVPEGKQVQIRQQKKIAVMAKQCVAKQAQIDQKRKEMEGRAGDYETVGSIGDDEDDEDDSLSV